MIIFALVAVIIVLKLTKRPKRIVFEVKSRTPLHCGCVLEREEVSGNTRLNACAAHQAMAESL